MEWLWPCFLCAWIPLTGMSAAIMKSALRSVSLVFIFLHAVAGCGGDDPVPRAVMSVCAQACVGDRPTDFQVRLDDQEECAQDFVAFEEAHPDQVCAYAWERVPTSRCIGYLLVGAFFSIPCTVKCSEQPDMQLCTVRCLVEELGLEGSCIVCMGDQALKLYGCLGKPSVTREEISACLLTYIETSSACSP